MIKNIIGGISGKIIDLKNSNYKDSSDGEKKLKEFVDENKNNFDDIKNKLLEQFKINFVEISNNNKSINENIIDTQENVSTRNSIIESSITEINSFNQTLYELREIY